MSSRADFLASLGLNNDDMINPDEQQNTPAPPSRTKSGSGGSSLLIHKERSDPSLSQASSKMGSGASYSNTSYTSAKASSPPKASGSSTYTSAILSMARDDSDDDDEVYRPKPSAGRGGTTRNATGSQEISAAPAPPPRAQFSSSSAASYGGGSESSSPTYGGASRHQSGGGVASGSSYLRQNSTTSSGGMNSGSFNAGGSLGGGAYNTSNTSMSSDPGQASSSSASSKMTRSEKAKEAESQKMAGNAFFQDQEYRKAVRCYSKAIEMDSSNAALYSNRSAAYLAGRDQMGIDTRSMALRDATRATELRPDWAKGYCRQGEAFTELEQYEEAAAAWGTALQYDPGNKNFAIRKAEVEDRMGPRKNSASAINNNMSMGPRRGSAGGGGGPGATAYNNPTGESARVLASRFHDQSGTGSGADFREDEMEKLRQRRSGNSFSSSTNSSTTSANPTQVGGVAGVGSSGYYSAARSVPQEFSSGAARDYQNSLLEAYRKKKQQGGK